MCVCCVCVDVSAGAPEVRESIRLIPCESPDVGAGTMWVPCKSMCVLHH